MSTQSPDTRPEAEKVQIELLQKKTVAQRFAIVRALSKTVLQLSRRAMREAHPDVSEEELNLLFVELNYGKELSEQWRRKIANRRGQQTC